MWLWNDRGVVEKTNTGIVVRSTPENPPAFKRTYTADLGCGYKVEISFRTGVFSRQSSGELTQPNGRWVLFDPERVADKIIDRELLPVVMRFVREIEAIDKAFAKNKPAQFIDDSGITWRRAP